MTVSVADGIARRHFLTLAAAGAGAALNPAAARAGDAALLKNFADQDSRLDGKPVFWLTRGREYVVQGGTIKPVCDRYVIGAQRALLQPDGGLKRPYVETAFALMPGATNAAAQLTSPFTGKTYPNPVLKPLRLTLWISPAGVITQDVKLDNIGVQSHYYGMLSYVNDPQGAPLVNSEINVQVTTRAGKVTLSEIGPYRADTSRRSNGFTPATRETTVVEAAPTYLVGEGVTATLTGIFPSLKFASIAELSNALLPVERFYYASWFTNWERLLNAPENVLI